MGKAIERRVCVHCGSTDTPLWRSGPDGQKTLCNADGMRLNKGKLQLYLNKDGEITANPGSGNKPYASIAKRVDSKRPAARKSASRIYSRIRKSPKVDASAGQVIAGKRPFTRKAVRKSERVRHPPRRHCEEEVGEEVRRRGPEENKAVAFDYLDGSSTAIKDSYGMFSNTGSEQSLHAEDSYPVIGGVLSFGEVDDFSSQGEDWEENEESEKSWDLNKELVMALSPLAGLIVSDGVGENVGLSGDCVTCDASIFFKSLLEGLPRVGPG